MSRETVDRDLRTALRTRLQSCPGIGTEFAWEGFAYEPTVGQAFVEDRLSVNDETPVAMSAIHHDFVYLVTLKHPSNEGTAAIEGVAGAIKKHFRVGSTLAHGTSKGVVMSAKRRGAIVQEPKWATLTVMVGLTAFTQD